MDKKFPMTASKPDGVTINIAGLPDLVAMIADLQHQVELLKAFAEDVFKAVLIPEQVHYYIDEKYDEFDFCDDALSGLSELLAKYRAMLSFLKKNGIAPEKVFGEIKTREMS